MATVAITGAARGIAFELVKQHLAAGDRVYALARNPDESGPLGTLAASSGGKVTVHAMDVGSDASVAQGAAATGSDPIDVLYNVAGVVGPMEGIAGLDGWGDFDAVVEINLKGPYRVLKAFLPRLKSGSKVINVSSQLAASTWPYGGFYAYGATKAGMARMMRSVAADLKDQGIVIGIVHPGYVQTDMSGPEAEITPEASAAGIRKLAAEWTLEHSGDFYKWNGEPHAW